MKDIGIWSVIIILTTYTAWHGWSFEFNIGDKIVLKYQQYAIKRFFKKDEDKK